MKLIFNLSNDLPAINAMVIFYSLLRLKIYVFVSGVKPKIVFYRSKKVMFFIKRVRACLKNYLVSN